MSQWTFWFVLQNHIEQPPIKWSIDHPLVPEAILFRKNNSKKWEFQQFCVQMFVLLYSIISIILYIKKRNTILIWKILFEPVRATSNPKYLMWEKEIKWSTDLNYVAIDDAIKFTLHNVSLRKKSAELTQTRIHIIIVKQLDEILS